MIFVTKDAKEALKRLIETGRETEFRYRIVTMGYG